MLGNSVTNEMYLGILKCAIFPLQKIFTSFSSNEQPGFSFIQAQSSSPNRSSDTPNALEILNRVATKIFEDISGGHCKEAIIGLKPVSILHYTKPGTVAPAGKSTWNTLKWSLSVFVI